jgi:phage terminase small subunit
VIKRVQEINQGVDVPRAKNQRKLCLTEKQLKFCEAYLTNGHNAAAARSAAGYSMQATNNLSSKDVLQSKAVQDYLAKRLKTVEEKEQITFDYKIKKLKQIVELSVPSEAANKEEINANAAISAISELNKMQGHYSAEKHANLNLVVDADIAQAKELMAQLLQQYKREY